MKIFDMAYSEQLFITQDIEKYNNLNNVLQNLC